MIATIIGTAGLLALGFVGGISAALFLNLRRIRVERKVLMEMMRELRQHVAAMRRDGGE